MKPQRRFAIPNHGCMIFSIMEQYITKGSRKCKNNVHTAAVGSRFIFIFFCSSVKMHHFIYQFTRTGCQRVTWKVLKSSKSLAHSCTLLNINTMFPQPQKFPSLHSTIFPISTIICALFPFGSPVGLRNIY